MDNREAALEKIYRGLERVRQQAAGLETSSSFELEIEQFARFLEDMDRFLRAAFPGDEAIAVLLDRVPKIKYKRAQTSAGEAAMVGGLFSYISFRSRKKTAWKKCLEEARRAAQVYMQIEIVLRATE